MPVLVCMTTGSRLQGEMFLRPGALAHGGEETVADRLNDGSLFFPLKVTSPQEAMLIVGKAHVRYVIAPSADDDDRVTDGRTSSPQALVTAVMDSEEAFTGVFFVESPPDKVRVLDYVNEPRLAFLPLTHLDKEYLLNREHILHFKDMTT